MNSSCDFRPGRHAITNRHRVSYEQTAREPADLVASAAARAAPAIRVIRAATRMAYGLTEVRLCRVSALSSCVWLPLTARGKAGG